MHWDKKGLIFKPDKRLYWSKSHAMIPTPLKLNKDEVKVFYSGRDKLNRSHIGYVTFDLSKNFKISELKPLALVGADEYNEAFFDKINEVENSVLDNLTFTDLANKYNLKITTT